MTNKVDLDELVDWILYEKSYTKHDLRTKITKHSEQVELETEIRVHERYELVPIKNLKSHMTARLNIVRARLANLQQSNKEK